MNPTRMNEAIADLSSGCSEGVEAVLRAVLHEFNGCLSAAVMEVFVVERLVERIDGRAQPSATAGHGQLERSVIALREALEATIELSRYVEGLADLCAGGPSSPPVVSGG